MPIDFKVPRITMELYETDLSALQEFIANEKAEEFTKKYLILYNFATDCKYSEHIQPESIRYLLPSGAFWTSTIWYFDDGYFTRNFFWNDDVVNFFDTKINRERIETLFTEVKPFICDILGSEVSVLFQDEMNQSFATGIFYSRKAEFLKKINSVSKEETYWDKTF